jgi:hypothetical protein
VPAWRSLSSTRTAASRPTISSSTDTTAPALPAPSGRAGAYKIHGDAS